MKIKAWFDKDDDENTDDQVDATPNMAQSVALQHFFDKSIVYDVSLTV